MEYLRLREGGYAEQKVRYLRRLFRYQEWHPYRRNGQVFNGCLVGINESGQLALETERGLEYFGMKEVEFIL